MCSVTNKVLDVKLHECFSGFCDTLDFSKSGKNFTWVFGITYSENFIQCSWYSGGFQSVTNTHWVASACDWCPSLKSYFWCIEYFWYFIFEIQVKECYENLKSLLLHNTTKLFLFVCRPTREIFTHMETSPLPVKGFKVVWDTLQYFQGW